MADKVLKFAGDAILRELAGLVLKDNGDGTYSLQATIASGGGGAATIADGADVTLGAKADAAIDSDAEGSVSGKLRGIVKLIARGLPASLGQATKAASLPVVIASDQGNVSVALASPAVGQAAKTASIPVVLASDQEARPWTFLGEQKISADAAQTATLPAGTTIIVITGETATVRWKVNAAADANSFPVAAGSVHVVGPLSPLTSFTVFNAASSVAYLQYYKEA